jgi:hypothetical protein
MPLLLLYCVLVLQQAGPARDAAGKSAYFAFVDRDFIFTLEFVKPGVPLFNFVSLAEEERSLQAKEVRLVLGGRTVTGRYFAIDTGDPQEPVVVASLKIRPRSSFGVTLRGDFADARDAAAVTVRAGDEEFHLAPLSSFDFENLVLKVNRINLGSPDFRDDFRVLKLSEIGTRRRVRQR